MDASDLKFPDHSFQTVTAFFSLMFMKAEIYPKVFAEAFRVLVPGGQWMIWDASIPARPAGDRDPGFVIYLHTKLPKEVIDYGYSAPRLDVARDANYYRTLAENAGFKVEAVEALGSNRKAFFIHLRKPS